MDGEKDGFVSCAPKRLCRVGKWLIDTLCQESWRFCVFTKAKDRAECRCIIGVSL